MTKKFLCKECQQFFFDKEEAGVHAIEVHGLEAEDCISETESLSLAGVIEDAPEENPSEEDSITEDELTDRKLNQLMFESWMMGELSETKKGQLLQRWFAKTEDKSEDKTEKTFREARTTKNAPRLQYEDTIESLMDLENVSCPVCHVLWTRLAQDENLENLSKKEENKLLVGSKAWSKGMQASPKQIKKGSGVGLMRIIHIRQKHKSLYKFMLGLGIFKVPVKGKNVLDPITSNPESLSAEQLAFEIGKDPQRRKKFFREWMLREQKKKDTKRR